MKQIVAPTLACILLLGCAAENAEEPIVKDDPEVVEDDAPPALEECDAAEYRELVGTNIAATVFPEDPMIRVYGEGDIITQEYIPRRTNIVFDADGNIVQAYCG